MSNTLLIRLILEYVGVAGIIGLISFVSWTKLALGAVLTFLGAFFPKAGARKESLEGGNAQIKVLNIFLKMSGGLRFGVVLAGLIVLAGSLLDAHVA